MNPATKYATIAPSVITRMILGSRIALAAFLGSTKMKQARMRVKIAPKTRQPPIANVPHPVMLAQQVGTRSQAALNAKRVALEHMVMGVSPVNWVTQGKAPIPTRPNVGAANLVRRRRQKDQPLVKNVMLVLMETRRDSARSVPPVTFKTAKENKRYDTTVLLVVSCGLLFGFLFLIFNSSF